MNKNYWEIPDNKLALEIKNLNKFYDGDPKNIAELAVFLASEKGQYITGQTISVDGGLYMI